MSFDSSIFRYGIFSVLYLSFCSGNVIAQCTEMTPVTAGQPPEITKIPDGSEPVKWLDQPNVPGRQSPHTSPLLVDTEVSRNILAESRRTKYKKLGLARKIDRGHASQSENRFGPYDLIGSSRFEIDSSRSEIDSSRSENNSSRSGIASSRSGTDSSRSEDNTKSGPRKQKRGALDKKYRWEFDLLTMKNDYNKGLEPYLIYTTPNYLKRGRRTTLWALRHKVFSTPGFYITPKGITKNRKVLIKIPQLYILPVVATYLIAGCCVALCCGALFKTENCFHPKMRTFMTCCLMSFCCCCPKKIAKKVNKGSVNYCPHESKQGHGHGQGDRQCCDSSSYYGMEMADLFSSDVDMTC